MQDLPIGLRPIVPEDANCFLKRICQTGMNPPSGQIPTRLKLVLDGEAEGRTNGGSVVSSRDIYRRKAVKPLSEPS
jgi:hypothetical protein